jgi:hypothetical protein
VFACWGWVASGYVKEWDGDADEVEGLALGAGRFGEHQDGYLGAGEPDLVAGQGCQVIQQGARAAAGRPIVKY